MRGRAVLTLSLGLLLAGGAVYLVHRQTQGELVPSVVAAPFALVPVVVADTELAYGHKIRREHLRLVEFPATSQPDGAFASVDELLGDGSQDRIALRPMSRGEPVLAVKVSGFGERASLSTRLDNSKRAFSIRINDVSGVAGFLLPGDRVDVLLTRQPDGADRTDLITDVILQNVIVLGIDQLADEEREKPVIARTATVEVTPEQAQKLALATQVGTLSLALRNVASVDEAEVRSIGVADLSVQTATPEAPRRAIPSVRVLRGSEVTVEQVKGF